ncbi:MAG: molybdopterin-dependent oxidoreductase [Spirochaetales bacterium]|nr:molybdopterin-dependent oxidoreductase [Spirochaetales bacterium]
MKRVPVSCNKDCGGGCPLIAQVDEGRVLRITNNPLGTPYMKGCRKGFQAMKMDQHPDRLTKPLIRIDGRPRRWTSAEEALRDFREAAWDEALDLAASRLASFKEKYGCTSLLDLSSGGSCRGALHNNSHLSSRFLTQWGGATRCGGNYSNHAALFAIPYLFGTRLCGMDAGNLSHSELIILWGYNAFDTRMGCEMTPRIMEAKKRGIPIVVIDPRETRTAKSLGTWWIPIRPGTDFALMAALLYQIFRNGLQDHDFIDRYSHGFSELKAYVMGETDGIPKSPEWASELCRIPVETIEKLADLYGRTKPAALLPGLSLQRAIGGEENVRMPAALQVATGNVGVSGGSSGGFFWGRMPGPRCSFLPVPHNSDPVIPVYEWPDHMLEGKFKGAYLTGSNLAAQGSDITKNIRAFQNLELVIGHDFFMTPTMALCDIVFPVASFLERDDIVFPAGNFLLYSARAVDPPAGVLTDYEIFSELSRRLGFFENYTEGGKSAREWLDGFLQDSDIPDIEAFKQDGIFIGEESDRIAFSDFISDPDAHPLGTPSGRIEIASREYEKTGFAPWPHYRGIVPDDPDYPLNLITPHPLQGIHSQFANVEGFRSREETSLWVHPDDAGARGLEDGCTARLFSSVGEMTVPVKITTGIIPGTVSLNEGLWPRLTGEASTVDTGGSANMLTSTEPTLPSRGSRTHTVFVQLTRTS